MSYEVGTHIDLRNIKSMSAPKKKETRLFVPGTRFVFLKDLKDMASLVILPDGKNYLQNFSGSSI
jgi:hypothetical protein